MRLRRGQGCVFGKCKEFQTSQYLHQYRKLSLINCPQAQQSVTKNTSDYTLPGYKVPSKCIEMNSIYYDFLKLETLMNTAIACFEALSLWL